MVIEESPSKKALSMASRKDPDGTVDVESSVVVTI